MTNEEAKAAVDLLRRCFTEGLPFVIVAGLGGSKGRIVSSENEKGTALLLSVGLNQLGGVQ